MGVSIPLNDTNKSTVTDHIVEVKAKDTKIEIKTATTTETVEYSDKSSMEKDVKTLNENKSDVLLG